MNGSYRYGLRLRFYGLFSQLPWSLLVTSIALAPVAYFAEPATQTILIKVVIYWSLTISILMLLKDLYVQRSLYEFSVQGRGICVYKQSMLLAEYNWEQLKAIRGFEKKDKIARQSLESGGVLLKFEDGFELVVFERVSNYERFNLILNKVFKCHEDV
jgi:hypothetical protein|tara:strand:- start:1119 stop:1592 length:474 start_codon:yes stop_codon:yes gene_type:complete